jgi:hemolysin activation/secretion protein
VPGRQAAQTDLVLRLSPQPWIYGAAMLDNLGSHATGNTRASASLVVNSPLRLADQAVLSLVHSEGIDSGRLAYSLPLGSDGWRIGASAARLVYRLTDEVFAPLEARGDSTIFGLDAVYPLVRSAQRNLFLQINLDHKRFVNEANDVTYSDYRSDSLSLGLAGNVFDSFGGGGATRANAALVQSRLDLDGSLNQADVNATTRAGGASTRLRYGVTRLQSLTGELGLYLGLAGQLSNRNLDSSEKFYLGGNYGVRAYPSGEAGGSDGQLVNMEVRWRLPAAFALSAFYDWGRVKTNHHNDFAGAPARNATVLKGAGLSLAWEHRQGLKLTTTWAQRIGSNPNAGPTGADQDGTRRRNRFWLEASLPF